MLSCFGETGDIDGEGDSVGLDPIWTLCRHRKMQECLGLGAFLFLSILLQLVAFLCDSPCPCKKKRGGGYLMYGNDGV